MSLEVTAAHVRAPMDDGGLEKLGVRIGRELDALDRSGIDIRQVVITVDCREYDEPPDDRWEWVAELRWPQSAEPEEWS